MRQKGGCDLFMTWSPQNALSKKSGYEKLPEVCQTPLVPPSHRPWGSSNSFVTGRSLELREEDPGFRLVILRPRVQLTPGRETSPALPRSGSFS